MHRPPPDPRKRRTRQHVVSDLNVNHVEKQVLLYGFTLGRVIHDYGIDGYLYTYDSDGNTENEWIPMQFKATDRLRVVDRGQFLSIPVKKSDLRSWLFSIFPVILIVYDAKNDRAYWLYLQRYFGPNRFSASSGKGTLSVRIPVVQTLNPAAIRKIASERDRVIQQVEINHDG